MNDGEHRGERGGEARAKTMRLIVAERQIPKIAREAKTEDGALRIVREAIEANGTLRAMRANHVDDEELLDVTCEATAAARPALRRELRRLRIARGPAEADPGEAPDADAEAAGRIADEAMRHLIERGEL